MATLSLIGGLFGCKNAQKTAKHKLSDVTSVSISHGNMDRSYSYSFCAHKEDEIWFFDAECFTREYETETVLKDRKMGGDDAAALLEILERCECVAHAENHNKTKRSWFFVADEETYVFCLSFSDGEQCIAADRQSDLEKYFYRLAEEYNKTILGEE